MRVFLDLTKSKPGEIDHGVITLLFDERPDEPSFQLCSVSRLT